VVEVRRRVAQLARGRVEQLLLLEVLRLPVEPQREDMLTSKFPGAPQTLRPSLQPLFSPAPVEDMQRGSLKPSIVLRNRPKMTRFSCIESKAPLCYAPDDIRRAALVYMSKSVAF
jgi:hypothetical protein